MQVNKETERGSTQKSQQSLQITHNNDAHGVQISQHKMCLTKEGYFYIIGLHSPMSLSLRKDACQNGNLLMSLNLSQLA